MVLCYIGVHQCYIGVHISLGKFYLSDTFASNVEKYSVKM